MITDTNKWNVFRMGALNQLTVWARTQPTPSVVSTQQREKT